MGRGEHQSYCILVNSSGSSQAAERLEILKKYDNGFDIADEDLKLRGPGDFLGSRQHGLPDLKISNMLSDGDTVRETHYAAEQLLKDNPSLEGSEYDALKKRVNEMFSHGVVLN